MRFTSVLFSAFLFLAFTLSVEAQTRFRGIAVDPHVSTEDIDDLATALGPKMVRYNLTHHKLADNETVEEYLTWLDAAMAGLDELLPEFESKNMKVMLQLYTPPGGFLSYESPPWHRVFNSSEHQDAFITAWQRIATHYASNTVIWGYDLLNEPAQRQVGAGLKNWNELGKAAAIAVRAIDSSKPILMEPIYGNIAKLSKLKVPKKNVVSNMMVAVHSYYPSAFNQQCLYGRPCNISYPSRRYNYTTLKANFAKAVTYGKKNKLKVIVNEFSAIRWAPGESSYLFLRDVLKVLEKNKFSWIYHAWREASAWSVEHTTEMANEEPSPTETDRAALLRQHFARP